MIFELRRRMERARAGRAGTRAPARGQELPRSGRAPLPGSCGVARPLSCRHAPRRPREPSGPRGGAAAGAPGPEAPAHGEEGFGGGGGGGSRAPSPH